MNSTSRRALIPCAFLLAIHVSLPLLRAQIPAEPSEPIVVLDPFSVNASSRQTYRADASAAGLGYVVDNQKIPIPISVVTKKFFEDSGSIKMQEALRYSNGVGLAARSSKSESAVLRGFGTGNVLRNGEKFNTPTDASIIESVEVIKGPAAIIYGTTDPAGVVNIVTKKPFYRRGTEIDLGWDEYGSSRASVDFNTPLANDDTWRSAVRVVATQNTEKFDRPNEYRDRTLFSSFLNLQYGRNTLIDIGIHRTEEDGRLNRIQAPWNNTGEAGIFARGIVPVARDFNYVGPNDDWDFRSQGFDFRLVQNFTEDLSAQISYVDTNIDRTQYFNLGSGRIRANAAGEYLAGNHRMVVEPAEVNHRGISAKLLYSFDAGNSRHKLTVGYRDNKDKDYEYAYYDGRVIADSPPVVIVDNNGPRNVRFAGAPRSVFSRNDPNSVELSGTTSATNPNPVVVRSAYVTDYISMMDEKLNILVGAQHIDIATQGKSSVAPQAGVTYTVAPGWNVYGLFSKSFDANGPASTLNPALGFLDPEEGDGREIGLKFGPQDGRISGSLALYEITRKNIVQFLGGGLFEQNNNIPSGEEKSKGVELEVVYTPAPGVTIIGGYAYTDAYISKQEIAVTPDSNGDGISDAVGLTKEGVAKNDIRLWVSYDFPDESPLKGISMGGGYTWRQGPIQQFAAYSQRFVQQVGDINRIDLFAGYRTRIVEIDTKFQLNWQNVTNADYLDQRGYFVQPSTVRLSINLSF